MVAGIIMFSVTYGINLLVASVNTGNDEEDSWLYVPGVGTWALVEQECDDTEDGCTFLIMHSVTHTLGLGLLIYGLAAQKQVWVRDASIRVVPLTYARGGGLSVLGEF
jgi:hypothetical protein